jgi:hypothetical protein
MSCAESHEDKPPLGRNRCLPRAFLFLIFIGAPVTAVNKEERAINILGAKVTALEIVLETLMVSALMAEIDPKTTGQKIIEGTYAAEETLRHEGGDDEQTVRVTETIVSLIERAMLRAIEKRTQRPPAA